MSNLALVKKDFDYQGLQVRTFLKDNEPWFLAKDVCSVLELGNVGQALARLDDDEKNTIIFNDGTSGNPNTAIVNEPGLYSLIIRSNKPLAKQFKRWITHEVLPSIRQTGTYTVNDASLPATASQELQMIKLLYDSAVNQSVKLSTLEEKVTQLEKNSPENLEIPVLSVSQIEMHVMEHMMKKDMLSTTQIAERYGMSAVSFYRLLHTLGFVQPAESIKGWVLDPKFTGKGIGSNDSNRKTGEDAYGFIYWTPKGRELIEETLRYNGLKPIKRLAQKKKIRKNNAPKKAATVL